MATLTVVPASSAGVEVVLASVACAAAGDTFANSGQEVAIFTNASVAPIVVTIATPGLLDGSAIANRTASIPAGGTMPVGPFKVGAYNGTTGYVTMTYATETDLSVFILKVTPA